MSKIKNLGLAIGLICICLLSSGYRDEESAKSRKVEQVIVDDVMAQLKDKNLHLVGLGGLVEGPIQYINLGFCLYQEIDLMGSRRLIVDIVDAFLSRINGDPSVKEYFQVYPMTIKELGVRIWVYQPDHTKVPLNEIDYAAESAGMMTYQIAQPAPVYSKILLQESYKEAALLVQSK